MSGKNPFLGLGLGSPFVSFLRSYSGGGSAGINCDDLPTGQYLDLTSETTFNVGTWEATPRGIYVSSDGTHMYVIGQAGDGVDQFSLSTPYDVTTASFVRFKSTYIAPHWEGVNEDIFFKDDGTRMYILGDFYDRVYQYQLSTAWNISTATYTGALELGSSTNILSPTAITFSANGQYLYVFSAYLRYVHRFALNTPWWAISGITKTSSSFPSSQITTVGSSGGMAINSDGTRLIITDSNTDKIHEYALNTPYSITSAYHIGSLSISADNTFPTGCNWSSDGKYLYVVGSTPDYVHRYETCTDGAYKILGRP